MKIKHQIGIWIVVIIGSCLMVGVVKWKTKQYLNWKLSYGSRLENRVELLEQRVTDLEGCVK